MTAVPSKSLERIRELVEQGLPELPEPLELNGGWVSYPVDRGGVLSRALFNESIAAAALSVFEPKTKFPRHAHEEREWLIVLDGELSIQVGRDSRRMLTGDFIYLPPGTEHEIRTGRLETQVLAVTVPRSPRFPT